MHDKRSSEDELNNVNTKKSFLTSTVIPIKHRYCKLYLGQYGGLKKEGGGHFLCLTET